MLEWFKGTLRGGLKLWNAIHSHQSQKTSWVHHWILISWNSIKIWLITISISEVEIQFLLWCIYHCHCCREVAAWNVNQTWYLWKNKKLLKYMAW
jgi:hypothetical protein